MPAAPSVSKEASQVVIQTLYHHRFEGKHSNM